MDRTMRTFVAIEVPAQPFHDVLDDLAGMGPALRTASQPLHLTLKFIGDTERAAVAKISAVVGEVCATRARFDVELVGIDAFPRRDRPSVVWGGVASGEWLVTLAEQLESRLEPLGIARQTRAFAPHITLARLKGRHPQGMSDLFELYRDASFGTISITEVAYVASELTPRGPRYTTLSRARLGDNSSTQSSIPQ